MTTCHVHVEFAQLEKWGRDLTNSQDVLVEARSSTSAIRKALAEMRRRLTRYCADNVFAIQVEIEEGA